MENAKPGHAVKFHSLKGAAHLNGTEGDLIKFLKKEQRWAVRCDDDNQQVVNVKPENLERVKVEVIKETEYTENYLMEQRRLNRQAQRGKPTPPPPEMMTSFSYSDTNSLIATVVDAFHIRRKGGAVVFYGDAYMLALEFMGPHGGRGITADIVYVDETQRAQAIVRERRCGSAKELGMRFLLGETVEYIEATNNAAFFSLLSKCKRDAHTQGNIDMKSGLKLYHARIAK